MQTQAPIPVGIDPSEIYMQGGDGVIDASTASIFAGVTKYGMHQKAELLEAVTCGACEMQNSYKIYDQNGLKIMKVKEDSNCCCRVCCRPYHSLSLQVTNELSNEQVLYLDRPFRCGSCCPAWGPCCQQKMDVYTGEMGDGGEDDPNYIGSVAQPLCGGFFNPELQVNEKRNEPFATISGPTCCFGGLTEMCCDQTFSVKHTSGDADVGQIIKEKPDSFKEAAMELATDADIFSMELHPSMPINHKALMLASMVLLDYMFFEESGSFQCNPCEPSCSIVCCYFYCCGAFTPCKCTYAPGESSD